jgi:hypothetical protein
VGAANSLVDILYHVSNAGLAGLAVEGDNTPAADVAMAHFRNPILSLNITNWRGLRITPPNINIGGAPVNSFGVYIDWPGIGTNKFAWFVQANPSAGAVNCQVASGANIGARQVFTVNAASTDFLLTLQQAGAATIPGLFIEGASSRVMTGLTAGVPAGVLWSFVNPGLTAAQNTFFTAMNFMPGGDQALIFQFGGDAYFGGGNIVSIVAACAGYTGAFANAFETAFADNFGAFAFYPGLYGAAGGTTPAFRIVGVGPPFVTINGGGGTGADLDVNGTIGTSAPIVLPSGKWQLGTKHALAVAFDAGNYVAININGAAVKLAVCV